MAPPERFDRATDTRAHVVHYWSYAVFVANSVVFLFLGIGENTFLTRLRGVGAPELPTSPVRSSPSWWPA